MTVRDRVGRAEETALVIGRDRQHRLGDSQRAVHVTDVVVGRGLRRGDVDGIDADRTVRGNRGIVSVHATEGDWACYDVAVLAIDEALVADAEDRVGLAVGALDILHGACQRRRGDGQRPVVEAKSVVRRAQMLHCGNDAVSSDRAGGVRRGAQRRRAAEDIGVLPIDEARQWWR